MTYDLNVGQQLEAPWRQYYYLMRKRLLSEQGFEPGSLAQHAAILPLHFPDI